MLKILVTIFSAAATWVSFGLIDASFEHETEEHKLTRQRALLEVKLKELEKTDDFENCAKVRDLIFLIDSRLKEISENKPKE